MYETNQSSATLSKTPEVFLLTDKIAEEIRFIRSILQSVIQETAKSPTKDVVACNLNPQSLLGAGAGGVAKANGIRLHTERAYTESLHRPLQLINN